MPKEIYTFKNLEDAISQLHEYRKSFSFPNNHLNKEEIIIRSVGSNIYRALSITGKKPSDIFRTWFSDNFDRIIEELGLINDQNEYDDFILKYSHSLINHWASNIQDSNEYLIFGPAIKMINLIVKTIQESTDFKLERLIRYQHVPFDLYTLAPLTKIINEITDVNYRISIPKNATMKYVNCYELYDILTRAVRNLAKKAIIDPIVYDYWSWNDKH